MPWVCAWGRQARPKGLWVPLDAQDTEFKAFTGLVRTLRDGGGAPPNAALLERAFGRAPNATRPVVVGVLVSGVAVAVLGVVVLGLMNQDGSGIVIDPEGVR